MIRLRQSLVGEVLTAGCMFDPQNLKYKKKTNKSAQNCFRERSR